MCQIFVQTISWKTKLTRGRSKFQKSGRATNSRLSIYQSVLFSISANLAGPRPPGPWHPTWLQPRQTHKYTPQYLKITYVLTTHHRTVLIEYTKSRRERDLEELYTSKLQAHT